MPSLILANLRSLNNTREELFARIHFYSDFKNGCIFTFFETWLHEDTPDNLFEPDGFKLFRLDRNFAASNKSKWGGVSILINLRWCSDAKIINRECSSDIENITICCRPFYLPREFSCCFVTAVYIQPRAKAESANRKQPWCNTSYFRWF